MVVGNACHVELTVVANGHGDNIWRAWLMKTVVVSAHSLMMTQIFEEIGLSIPFICETSSKELEKQSLRVSCVSSLWENTESSRYVLTITYPCSECLHTHSVTVSCSPTEYKELGPSGIQAASNLMKLLHNILVVISQKN